MWKVSKDEGSTPNMERRNLILTHIVFFGVEAFSASAEDVATPRYGKSHGFKVEVGQVGLR